MSLDEGGQEPRDGRVAGSERSDEPFFLVDGRPDLAVGPAVRIGRQGRAHGGDAVLPCGADVEAPVTALHHGHGGPHRDHLVGQRRDFRNGHVIEHGIVLSHLAFPGKEFVLLQEQVDFFRAGHHDIRERDPVFEDRPPRLGAGVSFDIGNGQVERGRDPALSCLGKDAGQLDPGVFVDVLHPRRVSEQHQPSAFDDVEIDVVEAEGVVGAAVMQVEPVHARDTNRHGVRRGFPGHHAQALEVPLVFLVPPEDQLAEIVVAGFADQFDFRAESPDGHARVGHGPAPDDDTLPHIDHLTRKKDARDVVLFLFHAERGDQVQAQVARNNDIQVLFFHARFFPLRFFCFFRGIRTAASLRLGDSRMISAGARLSRSSRTMRSM